MHLLTESICDMTMAMIRVLYRPLLFQRQIVNSLISSPLAVHTLSNGTSTNLKPISRICSSSSSSSSLSPMDSTSNSEIALDYSPMLRIYKDGRIERLMGTEIVPASLDPQNAVLSKDVVYSPANSLSVRLFIPREINSNEKLPLLIYFHGGAFIIGSPFNPPYHRFVETLVAEAKCVAVSVEYRRAPEHPVPAAHEDSWAALKWVAAHANGNGPEEWLNRHVDLGNAFLAGDSAGGNIAHHMAMKAGAERIVGDQGNTLRITGLILIHPYFWGKQPIDEREVRDSVRSQIDAIWSLASPRSVDGSDDPMLNVLSRDAAPNLAGLGCGRVLVFVAEKDALARRGWAYAEMLKKSGWEGKEEDVEVVEAEGETHVFHLGNPTCGNAVDMVNRIVGFIIKRKN